MDGPLGAHVRAAIAKVNLHAFEKHVGQRVPPDDDERQADRDARRHGGLKIRVPVSALSVSMFKALGASPATIQFSEVYSSLQTKVVDAQENPLPIIQVAKLYEVQKHCALTQSHLGRLLVHRQRSRMGRLAGGHPEDRQRRHQRCGRAAARRHQGAERDGAGRSAVQGPDLQHASPESFRAKLREAGFYKEWRGKFGDEAWGMLEGRRQARLS